VCNMCTVPAAATRLSQIFGATEKSMTKVLSSVKVGFGRCCVGVVILTGWALRSVEEQVSDFRSPFSQASVPAARKMSACRWKKIA
jgi:hypothetical protein